MSIAVYIFIKKLISTCQLSMCSHEIIFFYASER